MTRHAETLSGSTGGEDSAKTAVAEFPEAHNEAPKTRSESPETRSELPETRFEVDPRDFKIFSWQSEIVDIDRREKKFIEETLSINETLGRMVGSTINTIAAIVGKYHNYPAADHVIYLDKSARPVSWLVDEFWSDFTDREEPPSSFLQIDRIDWLKRAGVDLKPSQYTTDNGGNQKLTNGSCFDVKKIPTNVLAGIRALYIEGGVKSEDTNEIMHTPTLLDGKNILIVDEVRRTGATLEIARDLLTAAIPEAKAVNIHDFWDPGTVKTPKGEDQLLSAPAWYPHDHSNWRGRGVMDADPTFYEKVYEENPTDLNRARKLGALVLAIPLEEAGVKDPASDDLKDDIARLHAEYEKGHVLPQFHKLHEVAADFTDPIISRIESYGVDFLPEADPNYSARSYSNIIRKHTILPSGHPQPLRRGRDPRNL